MLVAGFGSIALVGLLIVALVRGAGSLPKSFLKILGYYLVLGGSVDLILLVWVLLYVGLGDGVSWGLSMDAFWQQELSGIYFIKQWLYSWAWNDLLNFYLVLLPAILFLTVRTAGTTLMAWWALSAARR